MVAKTRVGSGLLLGAAALSACAPAPAPARYAGWEPMPAGVPSAPSRQEAKERLAQSRALWQAYRDGPALDVRLTGRRSNPESQRGYSYVRARQASPERVEFTLLGVEQGRVVLRAFVAAHPDVLDAVGKRNHERHLESLWTESAADLGRHSEGARPRSIDELYADCERLIAEHPMSPRLYFHPDGLLMHCGFSSDECSGCDEVSIQSVSRFTLDATLRAVEPARWVCACGFGVFFPGSPLFVHGSDEVCYAPPKPLPVAAPSIGRHSAESCALGPELCELAGTPEESPKDICQIDPAACPKPCDADACRSAHWSRWLSPCPAWPGHAPRPLELGKAEPLAAWRFPFSTGSGIECGDPRRLLRVVQPRLPEALTSPVVEDWIRVPAD